MTFRNIIISSAAISFLTLSACKKQGAVEATPVATVTETAPADHDHAEEIATLAANFQRVQFAFDASALDEGSKAALAANAEIMKAHPKLSVEVQGHADDRGTTEYNLALGQRRAASVHDYLVSQGVSPRRVSTVSYGEERPLVYGASEVAWSTNRRADFRILDGAEPSVAGTVE